MRGNARAVWQALGMVWVGVLICLSLGPPPPDTGMDGGDKVLHALAYACVAGWYAQLYLPGRRFWAGMALVLLGVGLEVAQAVLPERVADPWDMLANGLGVLVGFALARGRLSRLLPGAVT